MRLGLILLALVGCGCHVLPTRNPDLEAHLPPGHRIPNEEVKTTLPPYIIEPPDTLLVDAIKVIPKVPYRLETLDIVQIVAENVLPDFPIAGNFQIEADGTVDLGSAYGRIKIADLSVREAEQAIVKLLSEEYRDPQVSVAIVQTTGQQAISGSHQVLPQGTINLGRYGSVYVTGMTIEEAKKAIEHHLADYLESPEVLVDVLGINSKFYYIITDGAGSGDRVARVPIVGGETVLDAISQLGGLSSIATRDIFIARPVPDKSGFTQKLPIRWNDIVREGLTATNYQILPNDRLYIRASHFVRFDTRVALLTRPFERISGTVFLVSGAIRNINQSFRRGLGDNRGGGFFGF